MIPDDYTCEGQLEFEWFDSDTDVATKYTYDNFAEYMNKPEEENGKMQDL